MISLLCESWSSYMVLKTTKMSRYISLYLTSSPSLLPSIHSICLSYSLPTLGETACLMKAMFLSLYFLRFLSAPTALFLDKHPPLAYI